jgi:pimeloyl-ACP methyl ester carboxylesterase
MPTTSTTTSTTTTYVLPGTPALTYDQTGPASGPLVLCLHGLSADRTSWSPVARRFGDRWRVCALDFRGHGRSAHTSGAYGLADYVDDAERLLEAFGRPTVVVGHSLGAIVAVALAQRAHPLVRAVFLEDPPMYVVGPSAPSASDLPRAFSALRGHCQQRRDAGVGVDAFVEMLAAAPHAGGGTLGDRLHHDALEARAGALHAMDLDAVTAFVEGRTFADFDPWVTMHCPVTVVRADPRCDAAFLPEHEMLLRAAHPGVEVVALDGGGHNLRGDRATRAAYLELLTVFLARHACRTGAGSGDGAEQP